MGEIQGGGQRFDGVREGDLDDADVSSVIYMGRGSFRMEAVRTPEPELLGVVQPVTGSVTAPLHTKPREGSIGNARAPRPRSLFGSQIDIPLLSAPIGTASFHGPVVSLSRPILATLFGAVLLCGIVVGTAARHLWATPRTGAVVTIPVVPTSPQAAAAPVRVPTPAPATAPGVPAVDVTASSVPALVVIPAPSTIRARIKAPAKPPAPARKPAAEPEQATPAAQKPWVDPWAS
jgi:hypothetical protein